MKLIDYSPAPSGGDEMLSADARSRRELQSALKAIEPEPTLRTVDDNLHFDDDPNKMFPPDELARITAEYPALMMAGILMVDRCKKQDDPSDEELNGFGMGVLMTIYLLVKHAEGRDLGSAPLPPFR